MLPQGPSQIYKAQFRGHQEDENYRCLSTFNFGDYFDSNRKPFGGITVLNDETLYAQKTKSFLLEEDTEILLLPLVGTIEFGNKNYCNTEEIQIFKAQKGTSFQIQNPYENELINYLQIRLHSPEIIGNHLEKRAFHFSTRNELFSIYENENTKVSIGIFDSRNDGLYHLAANNNGVFAFVINGAFEFQNRLVESRDGLAIWETAEAEFEALAENSILILLETTLQE
ncbi:pirin family protein [Flavobacterium sp.]|uniref:pirin family protein n=1 Tax=Flavobacterium sp. TaxID=239 RepID=UPI002FD89129